MKAGSLADPLPDPNFLALSCDKTRNVNFEKELNYTDIVLKITRERKGRWPPCTSLTMETSVESPDAHFLIWLQENSPSYGDPGNLGNELIRAAAWIFLFII